jgi:hypothetical protein
MAEGPDLLSRFLTLLAVCAWPLGIAAVFGLRKLYHRRLDRLEHPASLTSDELLEDLRHAFLKLQTVTLHTQTEYLPYLIERIREIIDRGLAETQVQTLLVRIDQHRPGEIRKAVFPIECEGVSSDLRMVWVRDEADRITIEITAIPRVIRALKEFRKSIPKAGPVDSTRRETRR